MLSAADPLPFRPRRVLVAGVSGVGKTTLARRLAALLGIPHTEIDALYHGPNWSYRESFLDEVRALAAQPGWVTEWQYRTARPLLVARADLLIWLDLPLRVTLSRLTRRTVRRRLRHEELWNGNHEAPLWHFFTSRDHIVRWAIGTRHDYRERIPAVEGMEDAPVILRIRTARDLERWIAGPLAAAIAAHPDSAREV